MPPRKVSRALTDRRAPPSPTASSRQSRA